MDAGLEHTMLDADVLSKFSVLAPGERWTTTSFASSDVDCASSCSASAAPAIAAKGSAGRLASSPRVPRRSERHVLVIGPVTRVGSIIATTSAPAGSAFDQNNGKIREIRDGVDLFASPTRPRLVRS